MTYSIVARDPQTGLLGVAAQSHWFSVGSIVPWAAPGVEAFATQAGAEISVRPRALALLADGVAAAEALAKLVTQAGAAGRRVAVIDAAGNVAAHTGVGRDPRRAGRRRVVGRLWFCCASIRLHLSPHLRRPPCALG